VCQEKPCEDDVEQLARLPFGNISRLKRDVRKALLVALPSRNVELRLVEVHPDRSTCRSSYASEFEGHIAAAASNVEAYRASRYSNISQESTGGRAHDRGEKAEPFAAFHSTSDHVPFGPHRLISNARGPATSFPSANAPALSCRPPAS
jgi:hypothetical protein